MSNHIICFKLNQLFVRLDKEPGKGICTVFLSSEETVLLSDRETVKKGIFHETGNSLHIQNNNMEEFA